MKSGSGMKPTGPRYFSLLPPVAEIAQRRKARTAAGGRAVGLRFRHDGVFVIDQWVAVVARRIDEADAFVGWRARIEFVGGVGDRSRCREQELAGLVLDQSGAETGFSNLVAVAGAQIADCVGGRGDRLQHAFIPVSRLFRADGGPGDDLPKAWIVFPILGREVQKLGEHERRAGAVGAADRDDCLVRERHARVHRFDRRIIPRRDGAGIDRGDRRAVEFKVRAVQTRKVVVDRHGGDSERDIEDIRMSRRDLVGEIGIGGADGGRARDRRLVAGSR